MCLNLILKLHQWLKLWKTQRDADWDRARMRTGTGQVLYGSSWGLDTASMPANRAQATQGVGKVPKLILASLGTLPQKTGEWPAGKTESEIKLLIQENGKPQDLIGLYTDCSVTSQVGALLSSKVRPPSMNTMQPIESQPPAWRWRWKRQLRPHTKHGRAYNIYWRVLPQPGQLLVEMSPKNH